MASHDGYVTPFGVIHERELSLSGEGSVLTGVDRFLGPKGEALPPRADDSVSVRFHLHPDAELLRDERERLVIKAGDQRWTFLSPDIPPQVEDSIFFASLAGARRTRQIVLTFRISELHQVRWRLSREQPERQGVAENS